MQNGTDAVWISGNGGQAQFSTGPYNGDMNAYISAVFRSVAGAASISPGAIQRTTVNGIPASWSTARVHGQSGQVDVTVFAYEFSRGRALHFVALTQTSDTRRVGQAWVSRCNSGWMQDDKRKKKNNNKK